VVKTLWEVFLIESGEAVTDLTKAGKAWHAAKGRERERMADLYAAIVAHCEAGGTETEAARLAGVDRMTVRRALGKR
jgi:DNA invertase Pin-like site-specific DNA recombinase